MKTLGHKLKEARNTKGLILRKAAALLDIDQSLISKFEKGQRRPTKEQLLKFSSFYKIPIKILMTDWLSEKFLEELNEYNLSSDVLLATEEKLKYKNNNG